MLYRGPGTENAPPIRPAGLEVRAEKGPARARHRSRRSFRFFRFFRRVACLAGRRRLYSVFRARYRPTGRKQIRPRGSGARLFCGKDTWSRPGYSTVVRRASRRNAWSQTEMCTENRGKRTALLVGSAWFLLFIVIMTDKNATAEALYEGLPAGPGLVLEDRSGSIYVAVLGEKDGIVVRYSDGQWETWHQGAVQGLQVAPDGDLWSAQGDEIVRQSPDGEPVPRTLSFMPEGAPGPLLATRGGDIWCAGCAQMRRGDALFAAVPPAPSPFVILHNSFSF